MTDPAAPSAAFLRFKADINAALALFMQVPVSEKLPPLDVPVWLFCEGRIFIGCRVDVDVGSWLWANCYGSHYWDADEKGWDCTSADTDEDYQPSHWQHLPQPPVAP